MYSHSLCFQVADLLQAIICHCYGAMTTLDQVDPAPQPGPYGTTREGIRTWVASKGGWHAAFKRELAEVHVSIQELGVLGFRPRDFLSTLVRHLQVAIDQRNRPNYNPQNLDDVKPVKSALFNIIHAVENAHDKIYDQQCSHGE